jgi:GDP-fucose transporter C1
MLGEQRVMYSFPMLNNFYFWFAMSMSGVLGFSISYVTTLQIHLTSPLTHNVSGVAKCYVQTIMAVFFYNEIKTALWWMSTVLVLGGSTLYSRVRMQEMREVSNKQLEQSHATSLMSHEVDRDTTEKQ